MGEQPMQIAAPQIKLQTLTGTLRYQLAMQTDLLRLASKRRFLQHCLAEPGFAALGDGQYHKHSLDMQLAELVSVILE
jgi:hypothetical protein